MGCLKTGAHIKIKPYDVWAVCDAFAEEGVFIFRISRVSSKPLRDYQHFAVYDWTNWFDQNTDHVSTMIARYDQVHSFAPDGEPL